MLIMPMLLARRIKTTNAITTAKTAYNRFILPPAELEEMSLLASDYFSQI